MVERKTRFLLAAQVPNKKSETVRNAILSEFRHFPQAVKSFTLDNGTEFADPKIIANRLNALVYFAHPHSPWERGTNENTNRLLRQYFPKKIKATYSSAYLADCRQKLNMRPRKCLGFASPASRFFFELRGCTSNLNVPKDMPIWRLRRGPRGILFFILLTSPWIPCNTLLGRFLQSLLPKIKIPE